MKKINNRMKGFWGILVISISFPLYVFGGSLTTYEDASNGSVSNWNIYTADLGTANITNEYDATRNSKVITFLGNGLNDGYMIGDRRGIHKWNNTTEKNLRWSMKYSEDFSIYVAITTLSGNKYLRYSNADTDRGLHRGSIHHGLGSMITDGTWRTFNRDLEADLKEYEPTNSIISVNAFMIRGSGSIDDLALVSYSTLYEDAEDSLITDWTIYSDTLGTASISNEYDADRNSRVIKFVGAGLDDGYKLGGLRVPAKWNNKTEKNISWSMNYIEDFAVYIAVSTKLGSRYLKYSNVEINEGLNRGNIHHGLGLEVTDGVWRTFNRDLEADLKEYEPTNTIIAVNAFMIRGSGKVDDIVLSSNDTEKPIITLNGNASMVLNVGDVYTDAGAIANDVKDGDITNAISTVNTVNTSAEGIFTITYDVMDSDGIWADQISREVRVINTVVNHAPTASNLLISGIATTGSTLTLNYTFEDIDGDAEGTPIIAWSTATQELQRGASSKFIIPLGYEGETISAYIIVQDEHGLVQASPYGYAAANNGLIISPPQ